MGAELLSLCLLVTRSTKHDVFFEYSGHVDTVTISIHEDGWKEGISATYNYFSIDNKRDIKKIKNHLMYLLKDDK